MSCRKWEVQILRWHERTLDPGAEARLLAHLGVCGHCRALADTFSALDSLFLKSREPALPPFLNERIVSRVSGAMREDSMKGIFSQVFIFLASLRPAVAGTVFVVGVGLGVLAGWDLARSISSHVAGSSYDLLSLAGIEGESSGPSLEFIWTDTHGRDSR